MKNETIHINGAALPLYVTRAAVVGSGAASLNGAVHLKKLGVEEVLMVSERIGAGVSANAGSDKQTYYRVNPSGADGDTVCAMAETLHGGGAMHGDIALVEAALSAREFYHLVELGVPFPHDRYGVYGGFLTDHDSRGRGTSAGPETSVMMFQKLLAEARRLGVEELEARVIDIITVEIKGDPIVAGLLALRENPEGPELIVIRADYVVFGAGGPGALYRDSVYPPNQEGALGVALRAGAVAQNLTESQFGIASVDPRWNLSGSYQQALPCYLSCAPDGSDEREFLSGAFPDLAAQLAAQFLKGYQWPFDARKVGSYGSSSIDLLVYRERILRKRRVFLDFRRNPSGDGEEFRWELLPPVVREYLERSGAVGETPLERLRRMNQPALEFYRSRGRDLSREPLEIVLCHQHLNGGLRGDLWWESNIRNFFPVGEANGSHGVYRPGGSALNAGQVGSLRAAQMIAHRAAEAGTLEFALFEAAAVEAAAGRLALFADLPGRRDRLDLTAERREFQERMSRAMGVLRDPARIERALEENARARERREPMGVGDRSEISLYLRNGDRLLEERFSLESALTLLRRIKGGRGSFLAGAPEEVYPKETGAPFRAVHGEGPEAGEVLEAVLASDGAVRTRFVPARPVPNDDNWFERDWADFRTGRIFEQDPGPSSSHGG